MSTGSAQNKVTLTLSPLAYERLDRLSKLLKKPMPTLISPKVEEHILLDETFDALLSKAVELLDSNDSGD